jgi:hypothetical protein
MTGTPAATACNNRRGWCSIHAGRTTYGSSVEPILTPGQHFHAFPKITIFDHRSNEPGPAGEVHAPLRAIRTHPSSERARRKDENVATRRGSTLRKVPFEQTGSRTCKRSDASVRSDPALGAGERGCFRIDQFPPERGNPQV